LPKIVAWDHRGGSVAAKKPDVKVAPKRKAAKKPFDVRQLWRMLLWGATAVCALLLAVLASRSEAGAERLAYVIASLRGQSAPPPFDAEVETRKLANAMRGLTVENARLSSQNEQLRSRLAAIEHHVDDVTGSLTKEIEAVKAEAEAPRPADTPPAAAAPGVTGSVPSPAPPSSGTPSPFPAPPPLPAPPPAGIQALPPAKPVVPGSSSSAAPKQYGVDIGSAVSVQALRTRWAEIRAAHPQLFQGLTPTVMPQSGRSDLRLVLGPLPNSDAAARLCASLAPFRLNCLPTGFDGQHLALQ
jgi:SPOR domain